ncbi:hypothetical protein LOK49_LG12G01149 [Camellia lanceoleosa]|uniref:Uncharacterized protein n=1 Tax=Camellia lanceoleosa TaxID=1840588 RepID=A0ACC0FUY6_9ERIC|nr:hypothetical protein LOK49_LG12G01149 [Camellia lanceoleosa]
MGATASNSINSPMMQKAFVSSMAGPDQLSGMRAIQQHDNSFERFQTQSDQSTLVGINGGGFTNPLLQKSPQEISQLFESGTGSSAMSDMGGFVECSTWEECRGLRNGSGNNDMMTVDFLGIEVEASEFPCTTTEATTATTKIGNGSNESTENASNESFPTSHARWTNHGKVHMGCLRAGMFDRV